MDLNQRQEELQNVIDVLLKSSRKTDWSAPLPFHIEKVVGRTGTEFMSVPGLCPDILMYLDDKFRGCKVYFPLSKYNPSNGFTLGTNTTKNPTEWDRLRIDLCNETMKNGGFHLISNGYTRSCESRSLICQHGKRYQQNRTKNKQPVHNQQEGHPNGEKDIYRLSSYVNDRGKNSRGSSGNKMARRTTTCRPRSSSEVCPFKLTIKRDADGFYLLNTGCTPRHCWHDKLESDQRATQSRVLQPKILETIRTLNTVHACSGICRDVMLKEHNTLLSLQQLRYLQGFNTKRDTCPPFNTATTNHDETSIPSSADRLVMQLCGSGHNHVCILQHRRTTNSEQPINNENDQQAVSPQESLPCQLINNHSLLIDSCIATDVGGNLIADRNQLTTEIALDLCEYQEMNSFAEQKRNSHNCTNNQQLMIGVAWVSRTAKRWFQLFPHVLFIDVTEDTNKESRPFLTISVKDSSGHHHVVLRAFLPNQRAWSFRWVFQSVLPKLLGDTGHLQNVNMCLTDGDSQETAQLDGAIQRYFPQARRRRCAYHMITRRWDISAIKKRVPEGLSCTKADRSSVMKLLRDWQYTWTDSQTETASEMKISVALFLEFVTSNALTKYATRDDVNEILKITRESILPYKEYFSFHRFSELRCYDARTTSGHEGTNLALKRGASAMRPNQQLETAAAIVEQKERHHDALAKLKYTSEHVKGKLWTNSKTSENLTLMGESLLSQQRRLAESGDLLCARILSSNRQDTIFHVAKKRSAENGTMGVGHGVLGSIVNSTSLLRRGKSGGPIPRFHRVRVVSIVGGRMFCTCRHFERFGIPCRHMICVMLFVNPTHEITHHDISVLYWKSYPVFAYEGEVHQSEELSCALSALSQMDICGPKYPIETEHVTTYSDWKELPEDLVPREAFDSVLNWTRTQVNRALHNNNTQQPQYEEVVLAQQDEGSICSNFAADDLLHDSLLNAAGSEALCSSYQMVIPFVKGLVKRIDNGGFHGQATPVLLEFLKAFEVKLNEIERGENTRSTATSGKLNFMSRGDSQKAQNIT